MKEDVSVRLISPFFSTFLKGGSHCFCRIPRPWPWPWARAAVQGAPGGWDASIHPPGTRVTSWDQGKSLRGSALQPPAPFETVIITIIISWSWGCGSHVKYVEPRLALQGVLSKGSLCFSHRFAWEWSWGPLSSLLGLPTLASLQSSLPSAGEGRGHRHAGPQREGGAASCPCRLHKAPRLGPSPRWCHFLCHTNKPPCDPSVGFLPAGALGWPPPAPTPRHPPLFRRSHHTVGDTIAAYRCCLAHFHFPGALGSGETIAALPLLISSQRGSFWSEMKKIQEGKK